MNNTVGIPLWLVVVGSIFAVIAFFSHFLFPSVRWFFRRSTNKAIDKANERLPFKLPNLTLTKRRVLIDRLVYDAEVMQAATEYADQNDEPMNVTMEKVERYAKEIIPSFNAKVYFQFGNWLCKKILQLLYRVRVGYAAEDKLSAIPDNASMVLVMNHRSNVDYVLVAYLAMKQTALSYAVGEWARVWPIQPLIKSLGGYFVRRNSGNPLYRKVLERYVQMAVHGGVVQAVFPEGGLSRDGNFREPKIGLLDYMVRDFDMDGEQDVVFVPIALNYDRVLEDKNLLSDGKGAERKSGRTVVFTSIKFLFKNIYLMMRKRWFRFGYAAANFGEPVSLKNYLRETDWTPNQLSREERINKVKQLADHLLDEIGQITPVLPVALVASVFIQNSEREFSRAELSAEVDALTQRLIEQEAQIYVPRKDPNYSIDVGLRMLTLRHFLHVTGEGAEQVERARKKYITLRDKFDLSKLRYRLNQDEQDVVAYYANSIKHLVDKAH